MKNGGVMDLFVLRSSKNHGKGMKVKKIIKHFG